MSDILSPKNRAKVEKEDVQRSERTQHAQALVKQAGLVLAPLGARLVGSSAIHYYVINDESPIITMEAIHKFQILTQMNLSGIPEQFADAGWKQWRNDFMKLYGRTPPRDRT
jgi:hypothetical protein